jgi:hypothetical protein
VEALLCPKRKCDQLQSQEWILAKIPCFLTGSRAFFARPVLLVAQGQRDDTF